MLVHPQSELIREPRLLVPGMQPLGPVRINTSLYAGVLSVLYGGTKLLGPLGTGYTTTGLNGDPKRYSSTGIGLEFWPNTSGSNVVQKITTTQTSVQATNFTAFAVYEPLNTEFFEMDVAHQWVRLRANCAAAKCFYTDSAPSDVSVSYSYPSITVNKQVRLVARKRGTHCQIFTQWGFAENTSLGTGTPYQVTTQRSVEYGVTGRGVCELAAFSNIAESDAAVKTFLADPYSLFVPA